VPWPGLELRQAIGFRGRACRLCEPASCPSLAIVEPEGIVAAIFEEAWNRQDFEAVTPALNAFRFHIRGTTHSMELDDLKRIVQDWHAGFPDLQFEIHAIVVNDGRAGVHATLRGTHRGPWQGRAPTGRGIEVEHMFFFRFDGERIIDVWELLDSAQLRDQLGP
jgi:steroid delta-isomerase-like uncharacterized protein